MGYEEDEFMRRWVRKIRTGEGQKELVQVLSSPLNIVSKYANKLLYIIHGDPGKLDSVFTRFSRAIEMELHPLWTSLIGLGRNKTISGETIINPRDPFSEDVKHTLSYLINTLEPIVNYSYGVASNEFPWEGKAQKMAREAYMKESGVFMNYAIDALGTFKYVRDIPAKRFSEDMKRIAAGLPKELAEEKKKTGVLRRDWIRDLIDRRREATKNFKEHKY
jgi:hypothetical protein